MSLSYPDSIGLSSKNPTPYTIRAAGLNDLEQLADVLATSFYSQIGWRRWIHPLLKIGIYEDLKQRLRSRSVNYICLTAISGSAPSISHAPFRQTGGQTGGDSIAGTVELSTRTSYLWRIRHPRQLYLSNLAVHVDCRRRGIGQQLLKASEQVAFEWGFQELYLHVMENNVEARRLYKKAGYRLYQPEHSLATWLWGKPKRLLMLKKLSPRV